MYKVYLVIYIIEDNVFLLALSNSVEVKTTAECCSLSRRTAYVSEKLKALV